MKKRKPSLLHLGVEARKDAAITPTKLKRGYNRFLSAMSYVFPKTIASASAEALAMQKNAA